MRILETAQRSPSGGNGQPWEIFVAAGPVLERIRSAYRQRMSGAMGPGGPPPGGPPSAPPSIQERMRIIVSERLRLLGLDPDDPSSRKVFMEWGARLNGVPVLVVVCMDRALSFHLDIGLYIQSVCIAARGMGVDSFIASGLVSQQDVIRKELAIPDDLAIITGIGLGYANAQAVINAYRSPRRPVGEVVRYREE